MLSLIVRRRHDHFAATYTLTNRDLGEYLDQFDRSFHGQRVHIDVALHRSHLPVTA